MAEGIEYRCGCRGADGKKLGKNCPDYGRRGHGAYYPRVSVTVGKKRTQPTLGGFRTITEARKARDKALAEKESGFDLDRLQTVEQWLEQWLAGKRNLRATTHRSYRQHIDDYLVPHLGDVRLRALRAVHISTMIDAMLAGTEKPGKPGRPAVQLRPKAATVKRVHATLRSALNAAVKQQRITVNPALHVELPNVSRPRVQPWSAADLGAFLDAAASDRLGSLYELMAQTGLRRGEALGLRWVDLDLDQGVIRVVQQLVDNGGHLEFGPPKTAAGEHRVVDLDSGAVATLLDWRLRQDTERATMGDAYDDGGLVFCREDGRPFRPEYVTRKMQAIARKAGLSAKRLHDLRHGQASLMLAAGVPLPIVSKRLGHSSISITSDTYSHLLEGVGKQAAEAAAALIPRTTVRTMCEPEPADDTEEAPESAPVLVKRVGRLGLEPRTRGLKDGA